MGSVNEAATIQRLNQLENLVNELVKEEPCEKTIKKCMKLVGLKYHEDVLDQLGTVLDEIHFLEEGETNNERKS